MPRRTFLCAKACSAARATWASWAGSEQCIPAPSADSSTRVKAMAGSRFPAPPRSRSCSSPRTRGMPAALPPSRRSPPPAPGRALAAPDSRPPVPRARPASSSPAPPSSPHLFKRLPLAKRPFEPRAAIQGGHPGEDLVLGKLPLLFKMHEDVDVVGHAAIRKHPHAAEELDAPQQIHKAALLLVVEEIRPVRHSRDEMAALARLDDPFLSHDAAHSAKYARPSSSIYSDNIYGRVCW